MSTAPFILEYTYDSPVSKVWEAITDKNKMKEWYFDLAEFRPEVGFEFSFVGKGHKGEQYVHLCRITEVIPQKKLSYTWRYENYEGSSEVMFELFAEGDCTRLKLTHAGLETFPQNNPDFARASFEGGWTSLVTEHLKKYLAKK